MLEHPGGSGFLHPKPQKKCGFVSHRVKSKATQSDSTFNFRPEKNAVTPIPPPTKATGASHQKSIVGRFYAQGKSYLWHPNSNP